MSVKPTTHWHSSDKAALMKEKLKANLQLNIKTIQQSGRLTE